MENEIVTKLLEQDYTEIIDQGLKEIETTLKDKKKWIASLCDYLTFPEVVRSMLTEAEKTQSNFLKKEALSIVGAAMIFKLAMLHELEK